MAVLERRLRRLQALLVAERARHQGRLESVRRAADRRLAAMMQEIATLRHHEARVEVLTRLLAERDAALAAYGAGTRRSPDGQDPRLPG